MNKVYVIQRPVPNAKGWTPSLEPAAQYGAIHFIFEDTDKVYADPSAAKDKFIKTMKDFDAESDYLCWPNAGDPAAAWLTIMLLVNFGYRKLKFLYWQKARHSGESGFYLPISLDASLAHQLT